jgi:hypothetical protein
VLAALTSNRWERERELRERRDHTRVKKIGQ